MVLSEYSFAERTHAVRVSKAAVLAEESALALAEHPDEWVARSLATRRDLSERVLLALAARPDTPAALVLAARPYMPASVLLALTAHPDEAVLADLLRRDDLPPDARQSILARSPAWAGAMADAPAPAESWSPDRRRRVMTSPPARVASMPPARPR